MTWCEPPGSLIVESIEPFTPGPAWGLPWLVSTGQVLVQPEMVTQRSLLRPSLVNAYRVRPRPLTRIMPRLDLCRETLAGAPAALAEAIGTAAAPRTAIVAASRCACLRFM